MQAVVPPPNAEQLGAVETPFQQVWRTLRKDRLAMAGLVVLAALVVLALLGKLLTEVWVVFDPATVRLPDKLQAPMSRASSGLAPELVPPFGVYFFGTDELGRSVFARMLQGSFVSLSVGFVAVSISLAIGVTLGGLAGFYGPRKVLGFISVDSLIMRFTDVALCFPTFFLILTVVALLPPSIYNIMAVIGMTSWMGTCRFVRAEFLSLREQDFVTAAKALGLPEWRIIFRHMVPNATAPVLVSASIDVAHAILTESALSFLGFGVRPPFATWGNILADGRSYIFDAPWLFAIPGTAILAVVLAFNLVGEGLRDAMNPKLRKRAS
jgi:peptide/nickel transport system permease protein